MPERMFRGLQVACGLLIAAVGAGQSIAVIPGRLDFPWTADSVDLKTQATFVGVPPGAGKVEFKLIRATPVKVGGPDFVVVSPV